MKNIGAQLFECLIINAIASFSIRGAIHMPVFTSKNLDLSI